MSIHISIDDVLHHRPIRQMTAAWLDPTGYLGVFLPTAEIFDPRTGSLSEIALMPAERGGNCRPARRRIGSRDRWRRCRGDAASYGGRARQRHSALRANRATRHPVDTVIGRGACSRRPRSSGALDELLGCVESGHLVVHRPLNGPRHQELFETAEVGGQRETDFRAAAGGRETEVAKWTGSALPRPGMNIGRTARWR